jgi:hypothetical protein
MLKKIIYKSFYITTLFISSCILLSFFLMVGTMIGYFLYSFYQAIINDGLKIFIVLFLLFGGFGLLFTSPHIIQWSWNKLKN